MSMRILDAEAEKVRFMFMRAPLRILGDDGGRVRALEVEKIRFEGYDIYGRKKARLLR